MARNSPTEAAGKALRKRVLAGLPNGWELDEREVELLALAAHQADVVAVLERIVKKEGVMATGSTGQAVIHPAAVEARLGRLAIDRLLGKIILPAAEKDEGGETAATIRARSGASARLSIARTRQGRTRGAA